MDDKTFDTGSKVKYCYLNPNKCHNWLYVVSAIIGGLTQFDGTTKQLDKVAGLFFHLIVSFSFKYF